jgi:trehalose 6-phosphate synthase/phosphatase
MIDIKIDSFKSLIVVSNRLPFYISMDEEGNPVRNSSPGGLVTALAPSVIKSNGYWIGWAGQELKENMVIPESRDTTSISHKMKSSQIVPIFYSDEIFNTFYNGMCNASLWPLMHSLSSYSVFKSEYWNSYIEVNKCFSNATMETLKKLDSSASSLVWIHDYHLLMMPMMLKNLIDEASTISCKIAFFLHIPFPSWDIFRLIPWANELLLGLLGCDLIAFHTNTYALNFLESCKHILGSRIDQNEMLVEYGNKTIVVRALPIGIPYDWFEQMARESPKVLNVKEKIILGVDRLDYTKGIIQRLKGYEKFLEKYPENIEKVVLLQIAVPSRTDVDEYKALKDEIEREIGRICGRFGTHNWTPVKYIYKSLPQHELAGYYRDAAIGLITPIRDGMNLVAKEYVACQINDPGVLIITPFTGAGETMYEALSVNPLEADTLADAIKQACDMKYHERKLRMNALQSRERMFNLETWLESFFEACESLDNNNLNKMQSLSTSDIEKWLSSSIKGYKLTIILDYDGTLVPLQPHPDLAILTDDIQELLEKLSSFPDIDVCIISGRSLESLKKMVPIKAIHLAGSHGMEVQMADGVREDACEQAVFFRSKLPELVKDLRENVCQYGGWVEEKVYHATFHWRDTLVQSRQIVVEKAREIIQKHGFQAQNGHFAIEARPAIGWDKGRGAFTMLEKLHGVTWASNVRVIFIGDDETDEDAMRALSGLGITFKVGKPKIKTFASHRLPNPAAVKVFLEWALDYMNSKKRLSVNLMQRTNQGIVKRDHSR